MADSRPRTSDEKRRFSSFGRERYIVLRGSRGLAIDRAVLRLTGYSLVTKQYALAGGQPYAPTLLLTTIGRRTGELRTVALPYDEVDGALVVKGSNGGGPTDPGWVHNVRADPHAWIRVRRNDSPVHAHVAGGAERERLFDRLADVHPTVARYQEMCAPRELPLVVLRPWGSEASDAAA